MMGIDNAHIYNHNMHYTGAKELMQKLTERTGLPVFNSIYDEEYNCVQKEPDDFVGFSVITHSSLTLQDYIDRKELLEFENTTSEGWSGYLYINPFVIKNSLDDCYLYRWNHTVHMCRLIRQYGLRTFKEYEDCRATLLTDVWHGPYVVEARRGLPSAIKRFGSTKMLTFCSDFHDEFLHFISENWTFDDFVSWGKKELIFVTFEDLPYFDFPETKPDYYNVMILDEFKDLK